MKYNHIEISNADMIDKMYWNNNIIILGELYQLSICRIHIGHNNSHFNDLSQHKMHLTFCVHKLETSIT